MKNFKKILSLAMSVLAVSAVFASCSDKKPEESKTSEPPKDTQSEVSTDVKPTKKIEDYVEAKPEYKGRVFKILSPRMNPGAETEFVFNEYEEAYKGDKMAERVNNAIHERNARVEEYLGITIEEELIVEGRRPNGALLDKVRKDITLSGNNEYQVINPCLYDCGTLSMEGNLQNLSDVKSLNGLESPWWDKNFNRDVKIAGKIFFTNGDMGFMSKGATQIVVFNRDMIKDHHMENPYELVNQGKWTIDKAYEMSKMFSKDLDDDGIITYKDEAGWAGQDDDMKGMFYSSGGRICECDEDGKMILTMYNNRNAKTASDIMQLVQDKQHYVSANDFFDVVQWPVELLQEAFHEGRMLFFSGAVDSLIGLQRMKGNYGILPLPKSDESQTEYYSFINPWVSSALAIPSNISDADKEFAGAVLECMGFYSGDTVRKEYYDEVLKYQYIQDDESMELLEMIMKSRGCDIGQIFSVGGYTSVLNAMRTMDPSTFRSEYEKLEDKALDDIERINELFAKIK